MCQPIGKTVHRVYQELLFAPYVQLFFGLMVGLRKFQLQQLVVLTVIKKKQIYF